jgi:nucleotide-binding universal stress UspA family protein
MATALKKILVATDFSEGSDQALSQAIELGNQAGASMELVHVRELGTGGFPFGPLSPEDGSGVIAHADLELARRRDRVVAAGMQCHYRCLEGSPANEIVQRAGETNADLIVIGTHGRRGLAHAMLGSVAERVVQHADCPVLTVPFGKKAA